jgi:hypothetical protein
MPGTAVWSAHPPKGGADQTDCRSRRKHDGPPRTRKRPGGRRVRSGATAAIPAPLRPGTGPSARAGHVRAAAQCPRVFRGAFRVPGMRWATRREPPSAPLRPARKEGPTEPAGFWGREAGWSGLPSRREEANQTTPAPRRFGFPQVSRAGISSRVRVLLAPGRRPVGK